MERFAPCITGVTLEVPLVASLRSLGWDIHKQADPLGPQYGPVQSLPVFLKQVPRRVYNSDLGFRV